MKDYQLSFYQIISKNRTAVMGFSMLSIMLFHQYFISVFPFNIFHNYGFWGVDIFLFLSGMGLVNSLEKNSIMTFYKRRLMRLVPACLICGTVKYFLFLLFATYLAVLKDGLNLGIWSIASLDLWFIHTILIFYLISPVLYHLLHKWPIVTMVVVLMAFIVNGVTIRPMVGFDWLSPVGILAWSVERLPVFAFGMLICIQHVNIDRRMSYSIVFLVIAACLTVLAKNGMDYPFLMVLQIFSLILGVPALIMICCHLFMKLPDAMLRPIIFLGTYSLELYLVHEFIFWSIIINFAEYNSLLLLVTALLLSVLSAYMCKSIVIKTFC